mmetsp:Transcript_98736/g.318426  ORF Transcript_98736/g.318426 Transcript_98736/m.318426 type:complete len:531 (+) Transcript_98736:2221-3813(+)
MRQRGGVPSTSPTAVRMLALILRRRRTPTDTAMVLSSSNGGATAWQKRGCADSMKPTTEKAMQQVVTANIEGRAPYIMRARAIRDPASWRLISIEALRCFANETASLPTRSWYVVRMPTLPVMIGSSSEATAFPVSSGAKVLTAALAMSPLATGFELPGRLQEKARRSSTSRDKSSLVVVSTFSSSASILKPRFVTLTLRFPSLPADSEAMPYSAATRCTLRRVSRDSDMKSMVAPTGRSCSLAFTSLVKSSLNNSSRNLWNSCTDSSNASGLVPSVRPLLAICRSSHVAEASRLANSPPRPARGDSNTAAGQGKTRASHLENSTAAVAAQSPAAPSVDAAGSTAASAHAWAQKRLAKDPCSLWMATRLSASANTFSPYNSVTAAKAPAVAEVTTERASMLLGAIASGKHESNKVAKAKSTCSTSSGSRTSVGSCFSSHSVSTASLGTDPRVKIVRMRRALSLVNTAPMSEPVASTTSRAWSALIKVSVNDSKLFGRAAPSSSCSLKIFNATQKAAKIAVSPTPKGKKAL